MVSRRCIGGAGEGGRARPAAAPERRPPVEFPPDVRIEAVTFAKHAVRHPRKIGRNSFKDHGGGHDETIVRVRTSAGVEGLGNDFGPALVGKTLGELLEVREGRLCLRPDARKLIAPAAEAVLLDIVGKLTKRPAAELLGPIARRQAPCYDGSIYMRDLDDGEGAIAADTANGLAAGHAAFKVKIGRGNWLKDRARGYERDLWAVRTVRQTIGKTGRVLVDSNNYYNLEESLRLVQDTAEVHLHWMEEMLQEAKANWPQYRALRAAIRERKLDTLLADGESGAGDGDLLDLIKEGVVAVSQPDIRRLGIFDFRDYAERIRPFGALIGPHTWAKQIGALEVCVLGLAVPNFAMVEDCRLTSDVVKLPGLSIKDGAMILDDSPGLGIAIDEAAYQKHCASSAKTVS